MLWTGNTSHEPSLRFWAHWRLFVLVQHASVNACHGLMDLNIWQVLVKYWKCCAFVCDIYRDILYQRPGSLCCITFILFFIFSLGGGCTHGNWTLMVQLPWVQLLLSLLSFLLLLNLWYFSSVSGNHHFTVIIWKSHGIFHVLFAIYISLYCPLLFLCCWNTLKGNSLQQIPITQDPFPAGTQTHKVRHDLVYLF